MPTRRFIVLERLDMKDVPCVTIDPEGSRDLDQALHLERAGGRAATTRLDHDVRSGARSQGGPGVHRDCGGDIPVGERFQAALVKADVREGVRFAVSV